MTPDFIRFFTISRRTQKWIKDNLFETFVCSLPRGQQQVSLYIYFVCPVTSTLLSLMPISRNVTDEYRVRSLGRRKTTYKPVANFYFTSDDDDAMCLERWQKVIGGYLCALWQKTSATTVYSILRSVFAVTTFRR